MKKILKKQSEAVRAKAVSIVMTIAFVIASSAASYGQEATGMPGLSDPVNKNILRSYGAKGFLSYIETSSQHLFLLANDTMGVVYKFEVPMYR